MKVIKGIDKGSKAVKDLESKLLEAKERIKLLEAEKKWFKEVYLLEVQRVLYLIPSFAKWGHREGDLEYNQDLDLKLNHGDPIERVKNLYKLLEEAIPRYRKAFDASLKVKTKKEKELTKKNLTPLEKKLYNFCKKNEIDLSDSIGKVHLEAEENGFKNLKGKSKLARSTVSKMLAKIRPQ